MRSDIDRTIEDQYVNAASNFTRAGAEPIDDIVFEDGAKPWSLVIEQHVEAGILLYIQLSTTPVRSEPFIVQDGRSHRLSEIGGRRHSLDQPLLSIRRGRVHVLDTILQLPGC